MPTLRLNKLYNRELFSIKLAISGVGHDFILDTGAEHSFFTLAILASQKDRILSLIENDSKELAGTKMREYEGVGGRIQAVVIPYKFNFCGVCLTSLTIAPPAFAAALPQRCSGLIGNDILMQFSSVEFNYRQLYVKFTLKDTKH